jgi:subfamily B ATP-binding cassette protein MsbA
MTQPTIKPAGKELYLRLLGYVRPYWKHFALAVAAMVITALSEPLIPALLKPLLDGTFVEKDQQTMAWTSVALVSLFVVRGFATFISGVAFEWVAGRVVLDLRQEMFERVLTLATAYYDHNSTGNLVSRFTYNVNQVTQASTKVLTVLVKDTLTIIGLIIYMLWLNWILTIAVFLLMPIVVVVVRILAVRLRHISRRLQGTVGDMTHSLEEGIRGHQVIKVFGGRPRERKRFSGHANWVRRDMFKMKVAGSAHTPLVELIGALMLALLIYVGTHQTSAGTLTVGGFIAFLTALGLLFRPLKQLTGINQPLQTGLAAAESIFELLDTPPEEDHGTREIGRAAGRIEFRDVVFRYPGAERDALDGLDFQVEAGQTVALVGASGGGKSTVINLIPRFYSPQRGEILLDGENINQLTLDSLRGNISLVGQDPLLFNESIAANIAFGLNREVDREELEEIARAAHALDFIQDLPNGFDELVGEEGVRLSGGQRQRIAIARALLKDAPILILDEATSALDSESEQHVQAALKRLTQGRTTLVIAHRLSTIEHADTILVIKEGRVVERGSHAELLARGGEYAMLYRTQYGQDGNGQD